MEIVKTAGYFKSFDNTEIYYETRGEGEPLVFVYGIACLMNHWHHQINYFSRNYKVISFDLRGHHKSNPVGNFDNLTISAMAKDVEGLLAHLNIRKAHFAGHSFGGPVLLDLYRLNPELFRSLCFVNAFAKNPIKNMFGLDVVEPFYRYIKAQYEKNPDMWTTLWRLAVDNPLSMQLAALAGGFNINVTHFKDIEIYARGVARMELPMFFAFFEELMKFNGDDILNEITTPTLIINGEKDGVTPKEYQQHLHESIRGSEMVVIPYGSHCCQLDFPDYFNLKYEKFLESTK